MRGQTILVTGAARRVGAVVARRLHEAGAAVAVHYRSSAAQAGALVAELEAARPGSALAVQADLLDVAALPALVDRVAQHFGALSGLVNNASGFYPTPLGEITPAQFDDLVGSNLKAPLFLSQAAAPYLARSGGCVVNIVDIHARQPMRDHLVYSAAKAGLANLTLGLARELGPAVRVNGVAPGAVLWPEGWDDDEHKAQIVATTALGRPGTPEDIATTVLFLLRDATYVTGQIVAVDGGRSIGW